MGIFSQYQPQNPAQPVPLDPTQDPNADPYLDRTNPGTGTRGTGPTSSPTWTLGGGLNTPGPSASAPYPTGAPTPSPYGTDTPNPNWNPLSPSATSGQGSPSTGGFIVPPGSLPTPTLGAPGTTPQQTDSSFASYANDPVVQAIQTGLQQGLQSNIVSYIQQRFPNAIVRWDAQRNNVDLNLGGGTGLQFDQDANGVWGVHPYNDATDGSGSSGGSGASGGSGGTGGADIQSLLTQLLAGQDPSRQNAFYDQLQGLIGQYGQPVTANDPIIKGQVDAFDAQQQRGAQQGQAALAEQNAYRGIPTGTRDAGTAAEYESAALNTGNFRAGLMSQELTARRNALQQTLSLYGGQLTAAQARQLQAEIAAINATLSNQQITNQNNQFYDQLGLSAAEQEALLNAQLVNQMSGG